MNPPPLGFAKPWAPYGERPSPNLFDFQAPRDELVDIVGDPLMRGSSGVALNKRDC